MNRYLQKITAIFLLINFTLLNCFNQGYAAPSQSMKGASENVDSHGRIANRISSDSLAHLSLPSSLGNIDEVWIPKSGKNPFVVLIQDAHASPDAQRSIQQIIQFLSRDYGIDFGGVEGAFGKFEAEFLRTYPEKAELEKVVSGFLDSGEISGVTSAALLNKENIHIYGTEKKRLYEKGVIAYQKAVTEQNRWAEELKFQGGQLQESKKKQYSKELYQLDQWMQNFEAEKMDFPNLLIDLHQNYPMSKVRAVQYPKLQILLRELQKDEFVNDPAAFEAEKKKMADLKTGQVLEELDGWVYEIKQSLIRTSEQRELDQKTHELELLKKLNALALSRQQWREIESRKELKTKSAYQFYQIALQRENYFSAKFLKRMLSFGRRQAFFVSGGFHLEGVKEYFKSQGCGFMVISPVIRNFSDEEVLYRHLMSGEVSWKNYFEVENGKVNLHQAFLRAVRDKLLAQNAQNVSKSVPPGTVPQWRQAILKSLYAENKISTARRHTKYLDELASKEISVQLKQKYEREWHSKVLDLIHSFRTLNHQTMTAVITNPLDTQAELLMPASTRAELRVNVAEKKVIREGSFDAAKRIWEERLAESKPFWEKHPDQSIPYNDEAPSIAFDPALIPLQKVHGFHLVSPPPSQKKEGFGRSREDDLTQPYENVLFRDTNRNFLITDPGNGDIAVRAVRWPSVPYDLQLVTRKWQPQILTPEMIRAEIQWALRGTMLEFHRPYKFMNHLHVHMVPEESAPIMNFLDRFDPRDQYHGVEIGELRYPERNIALRSDDPIALEQAIHSLAEYLNQEEQWYLQALAWDQKTQKFIAVFPILKREPLPFGVRASGMLHIKFRQKISHTEIYQKLKDFWLPEQEIAKISEAWWSKWRGKKIKTAFTVDPERKFYGTDQQKSLAELNREMPPASSDLFGSDFSTSNDGAKIPASTSFVLTYHGRVAPLKNLSVFILTAKRVIDYMNRAGKSVRVEVIGGDKRHKEYEFYLRELARREGIEEYIHFRGPYETTQLEKLYELPQSVRRIYLFTGENESFGLSPLEAMHLSVPVVSSDRDAVKEVIGDVQRNQVGGMLVPVAGISQAEKANRYALAVIALAMDPMYWKYASKTARRFANRFPAHEMARRYHELIQNQMRDMDCGNACRVEYVSPGLFPFEDGGISQWARNLLPRLQDLGASARPMLIYKLRTLKPAFREPRISEENQAVVDKLNGMEVIETPGSWTGERMDAASEAAVRKFVDLVHRVPGAGPYSQRMQFRLQREDLEAVFALHKILGKNGVPVISHAIKADLKQRGVVFDDTDWEKFEKNYLNQLLGMVAVPLSGQSDIWIIDSPHPFAVNAILSKYFAHPGQDKEGKVIFVQHSRGSEPSFAKIRENESLPEPLKAVNERLFIYFQRFYYDFSDSLVGVSATALEDLVRYGIDQSRSVVIPNGIQFKIASEAAVILKEGGDDAPRSELRSDLAAEEIAFKLQDASNKQHARNRFLAKTAAGIFIGGVAFSLASWLLGYSTPAEFFSHFYHTPYLGRFISGAFSAAVGAYMDRLGVLSTNNPYYFYRPHLRFWSYFLLRFAIGYGYDFYLTHIADIYFRQGEVAPLVRIFGLMAYGISHAVIETVPFVSWFAQRGIEQLRQTGRISETLAKKFHGDFNYPSQARKLLLTFAFAFPFMMNQNDWIGYVVPPDFRTLTAYGTGVIFLTIRNFLSNTHRPTLNRNYYLLANSPFLWISWLWGSKSVVLASIGIIGVTYAAIKFRERRAELRVETNSLLEEPDPTYRFSNYVYQNGKAVNDREKIEITFLAALDVYEKIREYAWTQLIVLPVTFSQWLSHFQDPLQSYRRLEKSPLDNPDQYQKDRGRRNKRQTLLFGLAKIIHLREADKSRADQMLKHLSDELVRNLKNWDSSRDVFLEGIVRSTADPNLILGTEEPLTLLEVFRLIVLRSQHLRSLRRSDMYEWHKTSVVDFLLNEMRHRISSVSDKSIRAIVYAPTPFDRTQQIPQPQPKLLVERSELRSESESLLKQEIMISDYISSLGTVKNAARLAEFLNRFLKRWELVDGSETNWVAGVDAAKPDELIVYYKHHKVHETISIPVQIDPVHFIVTNAVDIAKAIAGLQQSVDSRIVSRQGQHSAPTRIMKRIEMVQKLQEHLRHKGVIGMIPENAGLGSEQQAHRAKIAIGRNSEGLIPGVGDFMALLGLKDAVAVKVFRFQKGLAKKDRPKMDSVPKANAMILIAPEIWPKDLMAEVLRHSQYAQSIIILTAKNKKEAQEAIDAGAHGVIIKPFASAGDPSVMERYMKLVQDLRSEHPYIVFGAEGGFHTSDFATLLDPENEGRPDFLVVSLDQIEQEAFESQFRIFADLRNRTLQGAFALIRERAQQFITWAKTNYLSGANDHFPDLDLLADAIRQYEIQKGFYVSREVIKGIYGRLAKELSPAILESDPHVRELHKEQARRLVVLVRAKRSELRKISSKETLERDFEDLLTYFSRAEIELLINALQRQLIGYLYLIHEKLEARHNLFSGPISLGFGYATSGGHLEFEQGVMPFKAVIRTAEGLMLEAADQARIIERVLSARSELRNTQLTDSVLNVLPETQRMEIDTGARFLKTVLDYVNDTYPDVTSFENIPSSEIAKLVRELKRKKVEMREGLARLSSDSLVDIDERWNIERPYAVALEEGVMLTLAAHHPLFRGLKLTPQLTARVNSEAWSRGIRYEGLQSVHSTIVQYFQHVMQPQFVSDDQTLGVAAATIGLLGSSKNIPVALAILDRLALYAEGRADNYQTKIAQGILKAFVDGIFDSEAMHQAFLFNRSIVEKNTGIVYLMNGGGNLYHQAVQIAQAMGVDTAHIYPVYLTRKIAEGPPDILHEYIAAHPALKEDGLVIVDSGFHGNMAKRFIDEMLVSPLHPKQTVARFLVMNEEPTLYKGFSFMGFNHVLYPLGEFPTQTDSDAFAFITHILDNGFPLDKQSPTELTRTEAGIAPLQRSTDTTFFARLVRETFERRTKQYLDEQTPYPQANHSIWKLWNYQRAELRMSNTALLEKIEQELSAVTKEHKVNVQAVRYSESNSIRVTYQKAGLGEYRLIFKLHSNGRDLLVIETQKTGQKVVSERKYLLLKKVGEVTEEALLNEIRTIKIRALLALEKETVRSWLANLYGMPVFNEKQIVSKFGFKFDMSHIESEMDRLFLLVALAFIHRLKPDIFRKIDVNITFLKSPIQPFLDKLRQRAPDLDASRGIRSAAFLLSMVMPDEEVATYLIIEPETFHHPIHAVAAILDQLYGNSRRFPLAPQFEVLKGKGKVGNQPRFDTNTFDETSEAQQKTLALLIEALQSSDLDIRSIPALADGVIDFLKRKGIGPLESRAYQRGELRVQSQRDMQINNNPLGMHAEPWTRVAKLTVEMKKRLKKEINFTVEKIDSETKQGDGEVMDLSDAMGMMMLVVGHEEWVRIHLDADLPEASLAEILQIYQDFLQDSDALENRYKRYDNHTLPNALKKIDAILSRSELRKEKNRLQKVLHELERIMNLSRRPGLMRRISRDMNRQMIEASFDRESSLAMSENFYKIPESEYLSPGYYLGIDVGGTSFRVSRIRIDADLSVVIEDEREVLIDDSLKHKTGRREAVGRKLFAFIASEIGKMLAESGEAQREYKVGLGFSFPMDLHNESSGAITAFAKGWNVPDLIGEDPVQKLREAFAARHLKNVDVIALSDDTVATLFAGYHLDSATRLANVVGTGTDTAMWNDRGIAVDIATGRYDLGPERKKIRTKYDKIMDKASSNPRKRLFEKMVSGFYLHEIWRQILIDLAAKKVFLQGKPQGVLKRLYHRKRNPNGLQTFDFSNALRDSGDLPAIEAMLNRMGIHSATLEERKAVQTIAQIVLQRSAQLTAISLATALTYQKTDWSKKNTIYFDGSVIQYSPGYQQIMKDVLKTLFPDNPMENIQFKFHKNITAVGSGLMAAMVQKYRIIRQDMEKRFQELKSIPVTGLIFDLDENLTDGLEISDAAVELIVLMRLLGIPVMIISARPYKLPEEFKIRHQTADLYDELKKIHAFIDQHIPDQKEQILRQLFIGAENGLQIYDGFLPDQGRKNYGASLSAKYRVKRDTGWEFGIRTHLRHIGLGPLQERNDQQFRIYDQEGSVTFIDRTAGRKKRFAELREKLIESLKEQELWRDSITFSESDVALIVSFYPVKKDVSLELYHQLGIQDDDKGMIVTSADSGHPAGNDYVIMNRKGALSSNRYDPTQPVVALKLISGQEIGNPSTLWALRQLQYQTKQGVRRLPASLKEYLAELGKAARPELRSKTWEPEFAPRMGDDRNRLNMLKEQLVVKQKKSEKVEMLLAAAFDYDSNIRIYAKNQLIRLHPGMKILAQRLMNPELTPLSARVVNPLTLANAFQNKRRIIFSVMAEEKVTKGFLADLETEVKTWDGDIDRNLFKDILESPNPEKYPPGVAAMSFLSLARMEALRSRWNGKIGLGYGADETLEAIREIIRKVRDQDPRLGEKLGQIIFGDFPEQTGTFSVFRSPGQIDIHWSVKHRDFPFRSIEAFVNQQPSIAAESVEKGYYLPHSNGEQVEVNDEFIKRFVDAHDMTIDYGVWTYQFKNGRLWALPSDGSETIEVKDENIRELLISRVRAMFEQMTRLVNDPAHAAYRKITYAAEIMRYYPIASHVVFTKNFIEIDSRLRMDRNAENLVYLGQPKVFHNEHEKQRHRINSIRLARFMHAAVRHRLDEKMQNRPILQINTQEELMLPLPIPDSKKADKESKRLLKALKEELKIQGQELGEITLGEEKRPIKIIAETDSRLTLGLYTDHEKLASPEVEEELIFQMDFDQQGQFVLTMIKASEHGQYWIPELQTQIQLMVLKYQNRKEYDRITALRERILAVVDAYMQVISDLFPGFQNLEEIAAQISMTFSVFDITQIKDLRSFKKFNRRLYQALELAMSGSGNLPGEDAFNRSLANKLIDKKVFPDHFNRSELRAQSEALTFEHLQKEGYEVRRIVRDEGRDFTYLVYEVAKDGQTLSAEDQNPIEIQISDKFKVIRIRRWYPNFPKERKGRGRALLRHLLTSEKYAGYTVIADGGSRGFRHSFNQMTDFNPVIVDDADVFNRLRDEKIKTLFEISPASDEDDFIHTVIDWYQHTNLIGVVPEAVRAELRRQSHGLLRELAAKGEISVLSRNRFTEMAVRVGRGRALSALQSLAPDYAGLYVQHRLGQIAAQRFIAEENRLSEFASLDFLGDGFRRGGLEAAPTQLNFSWVMPYPKNQNIQKWINGFLHRIKKLSKEFPGRVDARIGILATAEDPSFRALKQEYPEFVELIETSTIQQAGAGLNQFLAVNPNALVYGLEAELENQIRLDSRHRAVRFQNVDWGSVFPVLAKINFYTAQESVQIGEALLKQLPDRFEEGVLGYDNGRLWVYPKAKDWLFEAQISEIISSMA